LLLVDFDDDEWPLDRKKSAATAQDFVFTPLYVDFDQLRRRCPGRDEVIQSDCGHSNNLTAAQHGAAPVGFNAPLRPGGCSATKGNSIACGARPNCPVHYSNTSLEPIPLAVDQQTLNVSRISIESDNVARLANQSGGTQSHRPDVGADIIKYGTRPNCSRNRILYFGLMFSTP
jgi:hypothetical protein